MTNVKVATRTITLQLGGKPIELLDPNPRYTGEQIRQFYLATHPELLNARLEIRHDPATGNETLTFGGQIGTKG